MAKTNITTRKIEIYVSEQDKDKRKEYYKTIRNWSIISRNYANDSINILQSAFFLDKTLKETNPDNHKALSEYLETSKRNLGYKMLAYKYKNELPSSFRTNINSYVFKSFSDSIKDVLRGDASLISYKKDFPLLFASNSIRNLTLDVKGGSFEFLSIPFRFLFGRDKSNNRIIIDKILKGEYKMADSSFKFVDNKLFFFLVVKMPSAEKTLNVENVLGVDIGIANPAYVSINNDKHFKRAIGSTDAFIHTRLSIQKTRRSLQKNLKEAKGGRGRNHKLSKLEDLTSKERNFSKTMNHSWSKQIVDAAIENNCGSINIEDLKGIGRDEKNSFILRNWSYFELQTMIQYKAERSIKVNIINPKYSSQRCSSCGHINEDNRETQSKFECKDCGYKTNAHDTSKNISIAHTDEYIKEIEKHVKAMNKIKEKNIDEMLHM